MTTSTKMKAAPHDGEPSGLSIVIVNWNSGPDLHTCIGSLTEARLPDGWVVNAIVVVDNGSTDDSCNNIEAIAPNVVLVRNIENRGFAAACNQGAAAASSKLILFLNPDALLFEQSLLGPIQYMAAPAHEHVGITGIQLVDESGDVVRCCARFPRAKHFVAQALGVDRLFPSTSHLMREWDHLDTRAVDQVIGAFFLVRRDLFVKIGGFDERFFVYFEEVDLALRAKQHGWATVFVANARAFHTGGGSSRKVMGRRLFYSLRSRLQYGYKHFSNSEMLLLCLASLVVEPIGRAVHLLLSGRFAEIRFLAEAYGLLLGDGLKRLQAKTLQSS